MKFPFVLRSKYEVEKSVAKFWKGESFRLADEVYGIRQQLEDLKRKLPARNPETGRFIVKEKNVLYLHDKYKIKGE